MAREVSVHDWRGPHKVATLARVWFRLPVSGVVREAGSQKPLHQGIPADFDTLLVGLS